MNRRFIYCSLFINFIIIFLTFGIAYQASAITGGTSTSNAPLITDSSTEITITKSGGYYFKFIPSQTTEYIITTTPPEEDTEGHLYYNADESSGKPADFDDYRGNEFYLTDNLTANHVYYLKIREYGDVHETVTCFLSITGGGLRANNSPTISITDSTVNLVYKDSQTISISGSVSDSDGDNVAVSATINGQTATTTVSGGSRPWTLTWNTTSIAEGSYTSIVFTANDGLGGTNTASYTGDIVVDKSAPTASVTYSKNPVKKNDSLTITANFSEVLLDSPVVKIAISGANTVTATNMIRVSETQYTYTYNVAAGNGTATVSFSTGTDAAGNVITAAPTSGANYAIDSTGPSAPTIMALASQPETAWNDQYLNLGDVSSNRTLRVTLPTSGGLAVADDTLYVYSDGSQIGSKLLHSTDTSQGYADVNITSATLGGLSETAHMLTARIIDSVGNTGSISAGVSVTLDKTAPTASVTYSKNPVKENDSLTITANFSEVLLDSPVVKIAISGANTVTATNMIRVSETQYTYTYNVVAGNGTATVSFSTGTDAAGNVITAAPTGGANYTIDSTAPAVTDFSPDNNALNVGVTDNLVITFGENVVFGSGDITIMNSDDSIAETISVTGGKVTGSSSKTITIDPGIILTGSTHYYVLVDNTAFVDQAGNSFAGITSKTVWSFTTAVPAIPTINFVKPAVDGSTVNISTGSTIIADIINNGTGINSSSVQLQIDGGAWVQPTALVPTSQGYKLYYVITNINYSTDTHTVTVTVNDLADNPASKTISFHMDTRRNGFGFGRLRFD